MYEHACTSQGFKDFIDERLAIAQSVSCEEDYIQQGPFNSIETYSDKMLTDIFGTIPTYQSYTKTTTDEIKTEIDLEFRFKEIEDFWAVSLAKNLVAPTALLFASYSIAFHAF